MNARIDALVSVQIMGALLATLLGALPARASFQSPFHSGRSAALGGTILAVAPEANALFLNPAGMARIAASEAYFTYNRPYAGLAGAGELGVGSMAAAVPTALGTFGAGIGTFMAAGLKQERTIALGFARDFKERVQAGVAARYLHHSHSIGGDPRAERDPVFAKGRAKSALALDLGMTAVLRDPFKSAVSIRNLNRPDVGLATEDRVPMEVEGGLAIDLPERGLKLSGGLDFRDDGTDDGSKAAPKIGVEKAAAEGKVLLRVGLGLREFSMGFGLRLGRIGFDYGITLHREMIADNLGSHRVGVSYRFGDERLDAPRLKAFQDGRRKLTNTTIRREALPAVPDPNTGMFSVQ